MRSLAMIDIIKIILILLGLLIPVTWYGTRIDEIQSVAGIISYLGLWTVAAISIISAAYCSISGIRVLMAIVIAVSAAGVEFYRDVMNDLFSYDSFVTMYQSRNFAGPALSQYISLAAKPFVLFLIFLVGVILPPQAAIFKDRRLRITSVACPLFTGVLIASVVYARGGAGARGLPAGSMGLPYTSLLAIELLQQTKGERESVSIAHAGPAAKAGTVLDIAYVIDESVRGDFLDINATDGVSSQLLRDDGSIHNFGLAAAATNCSTGTNAVLRFGGTRAEYQRFINTRPSIWQYAQASGYWTVYIDAQGSDGALQNLMDEDELLAVDEVIHLDDVAINERDARIAELIADMTNNNRAEFILANKIGAHFPVNDKYPDAYSRYLPALPRKVFSEASDPNPNPDLYTEDKSAFGDWERYANSYRNTLLWTVGHFFETLLGGVDLERAFIVYTSDHGQDFHEDGSSGFGLHCGERPSPNEGLVPLTIITRAPAWRDTAAHWSARNYNQSSHYNIFATLLRVMGYEESEVSKVYGRSLLEPTDDPMTFNALFTARFGAEPIWVKVDLR